MDDRSLSLPYRYGWIGDSDPSRPWNEERAGPRRFGSNVVDRLDVQTGEKATWWAGEASGLQEPCFAPREGSTTEGDGYVLVVASNYAEFRSELKILDAQSMEERATVILPFRLRSGTHGNWLSHAELPFSYA
jgi:carotenoid cleavage dioxygenase